jgi:hypothetical protein
VLEYLSYISDVDFAANINEQIIDFEIFARCFAVILDVQNNQ